MTVLVGYASAHGATRGVAERIAARLGEQGYRVEVHPLDRVAGARGYAAVVLGSAIHGSAWLPAATTFVQRHLGPLTERPVYTFSVGSVGERSSMAGPVTTRLLRRRGEARKITALREIVRSRDHHTFAGAVAPEHYPLLGRVIFRALGGRFGDHRDWAEIDAWAGHIAHRLAELPRGRP